MLSPLLFMVYTRVSNSNCSEGSGVQRGRGEGGAGPGHPRQGTSKE